MCPRVRAKDEVQPSRPAPAAAAVAASVANTTDGFVELFDATHVAIEYRYALGLKYLAERLS